MVVVEEEDTISSIEGARMGRESTKKARNPVVIVIQEVRFLFFYIILGIERVSKTWRMEK